MIRAWKHYDPILLALTSLATALGLFFIFDAGYARSLQGDRGALPQEFKSQLMFLPVALLTSWAVSRVRSETWLKASKVIWIVSLLLLVAVEVVGHELNGAKRWISLGPISIQPAEFAKLATVIYLAGCFANRPDWVAPTKKYKHWAQKMDHIYWPKIKRCLPALWVLISVYLIESEPDLGTAAVVMATAYALFFQGGVSRKMMLAAVLLAVGGAFGMVIKEPYRLDRVENHRHRWEQGNADDIGYQTIQSEAAMADGGMVGVGIGAGRAKHVLPATTTDFIMATVAEEFGLLGALAVLGVLAGIVWRLMILSYKVESKFNQLVLYGVAAWLAIQACVNVMMANGALPAIGIPLPFISSGGSSLVAIWMAMGVCQSMLAPAPVKESENAVARNRWGHRRPRLSGA